MIERIKRPRHPTGEAPSYSPVPATPSPKRRGLSLLSVLTTAVVLLVLSATCTVGYIAYSTTRQALEQAWLDQAEGLADRAVLHATLFLSAAESVTIRSESMMDAGELDPTDDEAMLVHLGHSFDAHPEFTWLTWARPDGAYLSVLRWPTEDGVVVRRTLRLRSEGDDSTWQRDWERTPSGWVPILERTTDYDPRTRPWWTEATARRDGLWVDPFLFPSRQQPGVSYAVASRDEAGGLRGVWGVEFECGPLSDFLATLEAGDTGRVYILDHSGVVVGHPAGQVVGDGQVLTAADHPDPMLREAWQALPSGDQRWRSFEAGPYLVAAQPFPAETRIPWMVLTVVPAVELYGEASILAGRAAVVALMVALIAMVLGVLFARHVAGSVRAVEAEMDRIAHFELSEVSLSDRRWMFRELNSMGTAHDRMKLGLRSFARYVPKQLVAHLIREGDEAHVGGVVREVTVLFTDIAGFTTIVESTAPDEMLRRLSHYLSRMNRVIAQTDGTVAQYLGDAIMAFWGAPEPVEDHALRACRAALAIHQADLALAAEAEAAGLTPLRTRIGVNTGDCIVGNIGADERFSYTILGDPVNAGARLEGLNKTYRTWVLVGELTASAVQHQLLVRPVDWVRAKGKVLPILVHELLCERSTATPEQLEAVRRYRAALDLYRARSFERAADLFETTPWPEPLASRCRAYLGLTLPDAWDGVHVMQTK